MNYYIEKHDMEMILDALECLHAHLEHYENDSPNYNWTTDEVDALFQSFDNRRADNETKELKPMEDGKFGFYTGQ